MRQGGGKAKGSAFERQVGARLSRWITNGARGDLFSRNVLSGGDFTKRAASRAEELGMPGDLMARHPLAFDFARAFTVECKHYADLGLVAFLLDHGGTSFLGKVLQHTSFQASQANTHYMVIARQNRLPVLVITSLRIGEYIKCIAAPRASLLELQVRQQYFVTTLDCLIELVRPEPLIHDALGLLQWRRRSTRITAA
jgi:hypothetical protein